MTPQFNTLAWFFGLVALAGFVVAGRLFLVNNRGRAIRWLAGLMLLFSAILMEWALAWAGVFSQNFQGSRLTFSFPLFFGVLMLGYYRAAFDRGAPQKIAVWHWIPGILFFIKFLPFQLDHVHLHVHDWGNFTQVHPKVDLAVWLLFGHMIVYPVYFYRVYAARFAHDPEMLRWQRWVLGAFLGIAISYFIFHFLPVGGLRNPRLDFIAALAIVLFMALVSWLGVVQPQILAGLPFKQAINPVKYQKSALPEARADQLATRIRRLFEQEKIYLDAGLTLNGLAEKMGVSRHHLSQTINTVFGVSFSDWVAQWRVKEAQSLLVKTKGKEMSIKEIVYQTGFNTKASFNLAFKKWTGMTPTTFRNQKKVEFSS